MYRMYQVLTRTREIYMPYRILKYRARGDWTCPEAVDVADKAIIIHRYSYIGLKTGQE